MADGDDLGGQGLLEKMAAFLEGLEKVSREGVVDFVPGLTLKDRYPRVG